MLVGKIILFLSTVNSGGIWSGRMSGYEGGGTTITGIWNLLVVGEGDWTGLQPSPC